MHPRNLMVFILLSALGVHVGFGAHSIGLTEYRSSGDPLLTRDMTEKEILRLIHGTMPYPVLSVRHGTQGDRRHFAINMNIAALKKSEPVFNVTFHVPVSAERIIVERAVHAAANYAIRSLSRLQ